MGWFEWLSSDKDQIPTYEDGRKWRKVSRQEAGVLEDGGKTVRHTGNVFTGYYPEYDVNSPPRDWP